MQTYQVSRLWRDNHASGLSLTLIRPPIIFSRLGITPQNKTKKQQLASLDYSMDNATQTRLRYRGQALTY